MARIPVLEPPFTPDVAAQPATMTPAGVGDRHPGHLRALTAAEVTSLTHGRPDDPCWTAGREATLIRMVDALHDSFDIDDALWRSAQESFDERQLLDVLLLCGWYHAICFAARTARVDLEPGAPRFADIAAA